MNLVVHSIDYSGSIVDGPGIRTVLFVQGCERRCLGCHNPGTWPLDAGSTFPVTELVTRLRSRITNRRLTISGGEPLLQAEAVIALLESLPEFNIVLYTGDKLDRIPPALLSKLDYIKVGSFESNKRTTTTPYVGSTNQQFIDLSGRPK